MHKYAERCVNLSPRNFIRLLHKIKRNKVKFISEINHSSEFTTLKTVYSDNFACCLLNTVNCRYYGFFYVIL